MDEMPVLIQKATSVQLILAVQFVREIYAEKFGTTPDSIWPECLVALRENQIIGVTALQFSEGEPFDVESHFVFDFARVFPFPRTDFVSLGRWVTTQQNIAAPLAFAAAKHALERDRKRSISCAKPKLITFLRRKYRLRFDVLHVPVDERHIPAEDRNFFLENPRPNLYSADLREWYDILGGIIPPFIEIRL